jgi:peptidoglycan/LPS O-acetylase OafA/YrhL
MTAGVHGSTADMVQPQENSFDALRLLAAYAVLFAHHFDLTKSVAPTLFGIGYGSWGVAAFFAISGYLVTSSYLIDPHMGRFLLKRVIRIFPGLIVCVVVTIFLIGPLLTSLDYVGYFSDFRTWSYLKTAVLNIKYELPGVFETNPYPKAVNGSLWTIPLEFKCYLALALACWIFRSWRTYFLVLAVFVSLTHYFLKSQKIESSLPIHALYPLAFCVGVSIRAMAGTPLPNRLLMLVLILLGAATYAWIPGVKNMAAILLFAICVIEIGRRGLLVLPQVLRRNDISYGVYLYAFLVQQITYSFGLHVTHFWIAFLIVFVLTTLCAVLSCKLVEQPTLRLKPLPRTTQ